MFAKINKNTVIKIIEKMHPMHPDLRCCYVACDKTVKVGDKYKDGVFSTPEPIGPTIKQIKYECRKRIEKIMPMWMVAREVSGGSVIPQPIKDEAQRLRDKSGELEDSLPQKYYLDSQWETQILNPSNSTGLEKKHK